MVKLNLVVFIETTENVSICPLLARSGCSAVSPRTSAVGQKADLHAPMSGFRRIASASCQRADPALKARFRQLLTPSGLRRFNTHPT